MTERFSQLGQDLWVLAETANKRDGFFVEFGACDGVTLSNSKLLEERFGWRGILAEPNPAWHAALAANRPDAKIDDRAVWSRSGEHVRFAATAAAELGGVVSTLAADANQGARFDRSEIEVETVSLVDLLEQNGAPREIDFLSCDTEGSEFELLRAFFADPRGYRFGLICVEHNYTISEVPIAMLLHGAGYVQRFAHLSKWDSWWRLSR